MRFFNLLPAPLALGGLIAMSACGGNAVPSSVGANNGLSQVAVGGDSLVTPAGRSILNRLRKDVVIGSTVDPTNGDQGPRDLSQVRLTYGVLKKGQLLVCNFADSSGNAGNGTTIEQLDATTGSTPTTFVQSSEIKGCAGDAVSSADGVYGAGLSSGVVEKFNQTAKPIKTYGAPIEEPIVTDDADCGLPYAPESMYVGDGKTGSVVKFATGAYGLKKAIAVITGFDVGGTGWASLGPEGIQYDKTLIAGNKCNDTLYITDGVDNTLVAVSKASNLLTTGEIQVQPGGKTFVCKAKKFTCAKVVYSGSPLNSPVALALLPNGNLVVANGAGGNTLVEISGAGKVLATKKLNTDKTQEVFGLLAAGTDAANTVLFYTDTADNSVHELER